MKFSRLRTAQLVRHASLLVLAGAVLSSTGAWAQTDAPSGPVATSNVDTTGKVPEVVVTATRRAEKDHDVPVSTAVLTPSDITQIFDAGGDIRALAGQVPSLNIESSNGRTFPRLYIRGYGNTDFTSFASQPVSLVYDDVDQENPALKGFPIFDVADVEVLRGPQGTLFGRNAPAGVVNVQSAKPVLGQMSETLSASDGTYNTANVLTVFNVPLGDKVAMRFSAQDQHRDSWVQDEAPVPHSTDNLEGYDDFGARIQLLYQPDSDFSALFNFHGRSLSGTARLFRANIIEPGTDDLVPGFDPSKSYIDGKNVQTFSSVGGSARLTWNLGNISIFSITGFEKIMNYFTEGDIDGGYGASYEPSNGPQVTATRGAQAGNVIGIPFAVETAGGISNHLQLTQEVRAQSNYAGPLNWQGGVYVFYEDVTAPDWDFDQLGNYVTDDNFSRQINDAEAVFVSVDYKPIRNLELRAGARYTNDYKKFEIVSAFNQSFLNTVDKATGDNISWDVSGTYTVLPGVNVYSRIVTGFRAPSFGAPSISQGIQIAKAETNTSGEIGVKSFLFDHRVKFDFDIYYYDVQNQQLTAVGGAVDTTSLLNAKKTIGDGAELNFEAHLTPRLVFDLAASYNFTRIEDATISTGVCASCTVTNVINAQGNAMLNGNPLPQAPKYVIDPALTYSYPLPVGKELFFSGNAAYRSSVNFFLYESKEFTGQPYTNVGLRGGYRWNYGKYEVAAYCSNCLNQIRLVGGIDFDNLTGFINDPVIAGVQFTGKW
jgi:iron complex outermembrane receptor protein